MKKKSNCLAGAVKYLQNRVTRLGLKKAPQEYIESANADLLYGKKLAAEVNAFQDKIWELRFTDKNC